MIVFMVFLATYSAFVVSSVAGGGAGLILVPLLRLVLPIASIPGALSIGTAASSMSRILIFRAQIRWDVVRRFVPTALPAAALGAWLLTRFQPVYVEFLLGCFLLLNLPVLFKRVSPSTVEPPMAMSRLPWLGFSAGLVSGFTGAVGVIFNRSYFRLGLTKEQIVATRATNEILLHLLKIALYAWFGLLPRSAASAGILVAVTAILASLTSRHVLSFLREDHFRRIGLAAMVLSGVVMFCLSGKQIMQIHQAWVAYAAPGDEQEIQLYWGGTARLAVEREHDGNLVVESVISPSSLPAAVQAAILSIAAPSDIVMIEEVHGRDHYYEVSWRRGAAIHEAEITLAGIPRNRQL